MAEELMTLKILLPYRVFLEVSNVRSIVADTNAGSYGFLPQRLDCAAVLVPGIFSFETTSTHYLALDAGMIVKSGTTVLVSVRNAIGTELGKLNELVEKEFKTIDDSEKKARALVSKMEASFMHRLEKFNSR